MSLGGLLLALVVFVAMFAQDSAASAKVKFLETGHPWLAGHCELVNDWGAALSIGISGGALFKYGASLTTVVIFLALGFASELGTWTGYRLTNRRPR